MREQVREVLLHEIGHYFGLEEEELRAIEKEEREEQGQG
jgi:predicted Zn-dependent protease with MMP-like domain